MSIFSCLCEASNGPCLFIAGRGLGVSANGMNDYARGALEALAWILGLVEDQVDPGRLRRQLESARDDILRGVSIDFRQRLKVY